MKKIYTTHGVSFYRTGKCNRCGHCEKKDCPHFKMVDGLATCDVYDKRDEICESCSNDKNSIWNKNGRKITHGVCKRFPTHPWLRVIKEEVCGYKFTPVTQEDINKLKRLNETWQ